MLTNSETDERTYLPQAFDIGHSRRRTVEGKLRAAVQTGAVFSAHRHGDKYVLVTASGSVFDGLSLKEAANIASFALAAFREGRATA